MSFALHPFYELLLKSEIKDRIMIRIEYIQAYNDWCDFDLSISNKYLGLSAISHDDIEKQCKIWKNIAKLSIDLWTDYNYYRQFTFESRYDDEEYRDRLENLGFIFNYGMWKSDCKPTVDVVQTNVFIYCLYRLIFQEMKRNKTDVIDESCICSFCCSNIGHKKDRCIVCDASIEEIKVHRNIINERKKSQEQHEDKIAKTNIEQDILDRSTDWTSIIDNRTKIKERDDDRMEGEERTKDDSMERTNDRMEGSDDNMEIKEGNGWKCGGCGFLNEYTFINCLTCERLKKDVSWTCGRCSVKNKCENGRCIACGEANGTKTEVVADIINGNKSARKDCWKCGKCDGWQLYETDVCDKCGGCRRTVGLWTCRKCTLINKCICVNCDVCGTVNKYLTVKYCENCKKNRTSASKTYCRSCVRQKGGGQSRLSQWQCSFTHCRQWNSTDHDNGAIGEYCLRCRLSRQHSHSRGDSVTQWCDDRTVSVWICYHCSTFNGMMFPTCITCERTRYKKRFCSDCHDCNDGHSINCDKCYQILS